MCKLEAMKCIYEDYSRRKVVVFEGIMHIVVMDACYIRGEKIQRGLLNRLG